MFPVPPLFKIIQEQSGTSWKEMYKVFNMGHRFEIYTHPEIADEIISISKSFNIDAQIIGELNILKGKNSQLRRIRELFSISLAIKQFVKYQFNKTSF